MKPSHLKFLGFVALVTLFIAGTAIAQDQPPKSLYSDLLAKVNAGDHTVSFQDLRFAYTDTKAYKPYRPAEGRAAVFDAFSSGKYEEALKKAETILSDNFLDLSAHFIVFAANQKLGNTQKAEHHKWIFEGLLKSIIDSGDGKSPETAMVVISVNEEYVVVNYKGLKANGQSKVDLNGHSYDRIETIDPKTQEKVTLFFNIDRPFNWLKNSLK